MQAKAIRHVIEETGDAKEEIVEPHQVLARHGLTNSTSLGLCRDGVTVTLGL